MRIRSSGSDLETPNHCSASGVGHLQVLRVNDGEMKSLKVWT